MGLAGRKRVSNLFSLDRMGERMVVLIDKARYGHSQKVQLNIDLRLARTIAAQAVELTRLTRVADQLWAERLVPGSGNGQKGRPKLRTQIYSRLYRWHEPLYRWYSKRGFQWLSPLRERIKRALLR